MIKSNLKTCMSGLAVRETSSALFSGAIAGKTKIVIQKTFVFSHAKVSYMYFRSGPYLLKTNVYQ